MRKGFEGLGCHGQVDIYGISLHFERGSFLQVGPGPPLKKNREGRTAVSWVREKNLERSSRVRSHLHNSLLSALGGGRKVLKFKRFITDIEGKDPDILLTKKAVVLN